MTVCKTECSHAFIRLYGTKIQKCSQITNFLTVFAGETTLLPVCFALFTIVFGGFAVLVCFFVAVHAQEYDQQDIVKNADGPQGKIFPDHWVNHAVDVDIRVMDSRRCDLENIGNEYDCQ